MASEKDLQNLVDEIKSEFPEFSIVKKDSSKLMKSIDRFLRIVSFGKADKFMSRFVTTIGTTVYTPSKWDEWTVTSKFATLKHERVHMRQSKKHGRVLFSLLYLFLPFPVGFAYWRMKFEMEAYEESLRTYASEYGKEFLTPEVKENFIKHFTTAEYMWMWPWRSRIEKWYDDVVETL